MPRGGVRLGAGRKARPYPKSKGIWCGQITDEQRDIIIQYLSPEERFRILITAANKACSGRACTCPKILNGRDTLCPIHGDLHNPARR